MQSNGGKPWFRQQSTANMSYAATLLEIAFNGFYAQLDDNLAESPKLAQ